MEILISLQSLLQQLDLLVAFNSSTFCIGAALPITLILIQTNHLLDTSFVLFFDTELELELGQHELNFGSEILGIIFDQVCMIAIRN